MSALTRAQNDGCAAAVPLVDRINAAYAARIWLQGKDRKQEFEDLFNAVGDALRTHYRTDKLILYSTLEPCRDYETQPSCACIICATQIGAVHYASDDTNPKGQGRDVLISGRDPDDRVIRKTPIEVKPNIAVDDALKINRLFFSSVQLADELFHDHDPHARGSAPCYAYFNLLQDRLKVSFDRAARLQLVQDQTAKFEINYLDATFFDLPAPQRAIQVGKYPHDDEIVSNARVDDNAVMFVRNIEADTIAKLLRDKVRHGGQVPAHIVSTRQLDAATEGTLAKLVETGRVTIHSNAFRKREEFAEAYRFVTLSRIRADLQGHIYLLLKSSDETPSGDLSTSTAGQLPPGRVSPYAALHGEPKLLVDNLVEVSGREQIGPSVGRLIAFSDCNDPGPISALIRALKNRNCFDDGARLGAASIEVHLCSLLTADDILSSRKQIEKLVRELNLQYRVNIRHQHLHEALSIRAIAALISSNRVDLRVFSPEFLKTLTRSFDWRDSICWYRPPSKMFTQRLRHT